MFQIFISESLLRKVIATEASCPPTRRSFLFSVILECGQIYVGSPSAPDSEWADMIFRAHKLKLDYSKSDYIQDIPLHPETLLQHPSSLFVLDIPAEEARRLQTSYGVMCLGREHGDIAALIDTNDEQTTSEGEPLGNGWPTVLRSIQGIPSNALLLTDRYLFSTLSPRVGNGLDNVQSILNALLPQHFLGEYHVVVIFDSDSLHNSFTFSDIATRLNRLKQSLHRDYPIMMEVLGITPDCAVYNRLHNRRIVSNYYIVKAEHKLAAFNGNRGTTFQTITPQVLFTEDSLNNHSTPPLKSIDQIIASLREFSATAARNSSLYDYALNGKVMEKCMAVRSRLLK